VTNADIDRWTERLSEYLDGDLTPRESAELERHLETCGPCQDVLRDLTALCANAAHLEDAAPAADLWPGIAARIAERPRGLRARIAAWLGGGARLAFSLPQLAAASVMLIVLSGGGVWLAIRGGVLPAPGPAVTTSPIASTQTPHNTPSAAARSGANAAGGADAQLAGYNLTRYDATIGELQQVLTDNRGDLDSTTVRIIEQNLALIDQAIADARRALAADPANSYLNGHLTQQLQRKVRLLQKATVLVADHQG